MDHTVSALRIGAIIQARLGSSRLPGKALLPLPLSGNTTVLEQVIRRAQRSRIHTVIVATSEHERDDAVAQTALAAGAFVFRGSETDVLTRFYGAAQEHDLDVVVRLTGDNPALDPHYLNQALEQHLAQAADYTYTSGLPLGTNLEIIGRQALEQAHRLARLPDEREHVTPYLRRHPEQFALLTLPLALDTRWAGVRLTLDYPSDYALLHALYAALPPNFGLDEVYQLLERYPWLKEINGQNEQIKV